MNRLFLASCGVLSLLTVNVLSFSLDDQHLGYQKEDIQEEGAVRDIKISIENLPSNASFDPVKITSRLKTKIGDPFSELTFDQDLKTLSEEYDRVEPDVKVSRDGVSITLNLWLRPTIESISWHGNEHFKTKALQKELGVKPNTTFNREKFNQSFNKVKEYYIKNGYFEARLHYVAEPEPGTNDIALHIYVEEGRSGRVENISFTGFTSEEKSQIYEMIHTKKYNFFTSWLTGNGIFQEEALDQDKLYIVHLLQNRGYADATVNIQIKEGKQKDKISIEITAERGQKYHFGEIAIHGNDLFTQEEVEKNLSIHAGDVYSPENLRKAVEKLQELYGQKGHIEAHVSYELKLDPEAPIYGVSFSVDEGEQYKIGLIRVIGNSTTSTGVILHESLLTPGDIFDARKLKRTQERLQNIGYFKSVNVYAVRSQEDRNLGPNFRDVYIEVEETTTGNVSLFFGFSTADSIFGGLDLVESNFNHKGFGKIHSKGLSSLRGGGEYAHAKVSVGGRQTNYLVSWLTPYWRDSLWRVGFDVNRAISHLQSKEYDINSAGFSLFASYPLTPFWTWGNKARFRNAIIRVNDSKNEKSAEEEKNSGIVIGIGPSLTFDSTDNSYKPHKGFRSGIEAEICGIRRHDQEERTFPFARFNYVNSYYYPVWKTGTLKFRADAKLIFPFGDGKALHLPLSERLFLGGETSVRGYRAFALGPKYTDSEPKGGISSALASVEYLQELFPRVDLFAFFDGGSVSLREFNIKEFNMSYGFGGRLEVMNRMPMILGMGFPINPSDPSEVRKFFFSMGGQF